jgi:hypothetical protein
LLFVAEDKVDMVGKVDNFASFEYCHTVVCIAAVVVIEYCHTVVCIAAVLEIEYCHIVVCIAAVVVIGYSIESLVVEELIEFGYIELPVQVCIEGLHRLVVAILVQLANHSCCSRSLDHCHNRS